MTISGKKDTVRVTVMLNSTALRQVDHLRADQRCTRSALITAAVQEYLRAHTYSMEGGDGHASKV